MIPPRRPPELDHKIFRGTWAISHGLLTRDDLRGPAWQRLLPDVYVAAEASIGHALRARAAAGLLLRHGVITGASAAVLWGLDDLAGPADPVELTVPPGAARTSCPGVRIRRRTLAPVDVVRARQVQVLRPVPMALELAARLGPVEAVVLLDRVVDARLATLPELRAAAAAGTGRGCRQARSAAGAADGLSGSPQETRLRLVVHRSALPRPTAQYVVQHRGRFVARVDFGWPDQRVALEYEGAWHTRHIAADRAGSRRCRPRAGGCCS